MKIKGPLTDAAFLERPNRFLTMVKIDGGREESHLPDPGRLKELLVPGARIRVRRASDGSLLTRKTRWTTVMVKAGSHWVSIDSTLPNRFVKWLLDRGDLPMFRGWGLVRTEVPYGRHRFDFLLEKEGRLLYLEVKSVTLVEGGVGMFPDAVTQRGSRQMAALADLVRSGVDSGVLFVCQRGDVELFRPQWDRDPGFARALVEAEKTGVKVWAISAEVTGTAIRFKNEIPCDLTPF
ncbi:MAG: DNA/RNA nuclease SfsA [Fidelibacterota bacterium]